MPLLETLLKISEHYSTQKTRKSKSSSKIVE